MLLFMDEDYLESGISAQKLLKMLGKVAMVADVRLQSRASIHAHHHPQLQRSACTITIRFLFYTIMDLQDQYY
jgi:hypothetical protein